MANNSTSSTPIIRISQLPTETEMTVSGNPANTWFAIINADQMRTKKMTLESLMKFIAIYLKPSEINFINIFPEGGIECNSTIYLGNTLIISDNITFTRANAAFDAANTAGGNSAAAFIKANVAYFAANNAFIKANAAYAHANSAYNKANGYFVLNTDGGVRINETLKSTNVFFGNTIQISDNITYNIAVSANSQSHLPITINTSGGISGGLGVRLGETINLSAVNVYNHANAAYARSNNSIINPKINYVTSNGTTAYANNRYLILANNIILTLQNNPVVNTYVHVTNMTYSETNKIYPGSSKIHGLNVGEELTLDLPQISVTLCYVDSTRGWVIV